MSVACPRHAWTPDLLPSRADAARPPITGLRSHWTSDLTQTGGEAPASASERCCTALGGVCRRPAGSGPRPVRGRPQRVPRSVQTAMEAKTFSFEDIVGGLTKMGSMGGSLGGDFPRSPSEQAFQVWAPLSSHVARLRRQLCLCQHLYTSSDLLAHHDRAAWLSKRLPREAGATSAHSSHGGRLLCSR